MRDFLRRRHLAAELLELRGHALDGAHYAFAHFDLIGAADDVGEGFFCDRAREDRGARRAVARLVVRPRRYVLDELGAHRLELVL